jgi:tetratricopeptide (TPR) repeat protein
VPRPPVTGLDRLAELRHRDPADVRRRVEALLTTGSLEPRQSSAAYWVLGLVLHELGDPHAALGHYRRAASTARRCGDRDRLALSRASMAISWLSVGRAPAAERALSAARRAAGDDVGPVVELLVGLVRQRTGRLEEALVTYERALPRLRSAADDASVARLTLNRGILHGYRGDLTAALEDLAESERLAGTLDLPVITAMAAHNTGFAHGRRGDVPAALAAFDRAEDAYRLLGHPARLEAVLHADRCEVLLEAGLSTEARRAAELSVAELDAGGDVGHRTESQLLLARALLAEGRPEAAGVQAELAAQSFEGLGSPTWTALAHYVAIQAEVAAVQEQRRPPEALLERSMAIAAELEGQGWGAEALHVRTFVGRMALALGRHDVARTEPARTERARSTGTAAARARAWHAAALQHLADGDHRSATSALDSGMTVVEAYRATLGATELRAQAASLAADLARTGLRLALGDQDPAATLSWAERWRAGALRRPLVHPPDDSALATDLAELRRWHTEARQAALSGDDARPAQAAVARYEEAVRRRTRNRRDDGDEDRRLAVETGVGALQDRLLVEYVALEGDLYAVTAVGGALRLVELGPSDTVDDELRYLVFALRSLLPGRPAAGQAELIAAARRAAAALDHLLVAPLDLPPAGEVVLVPTGSLHGLPWGVLPTWDGRPVTIAPSLAVWAHPVADPARPEHVALVAGPGVPGGADEVRALEELYPRSRVLLGEAASTAAVLDALAGVGLAHLAAHGRFRADSPLFSSLLLPDGPLTVYDLERLRTVPRTFVLPACDAATAAVRSGDELLGTAAALLGLGAASVIAPVLAVPDGATTGLMLGLHRALGAGCTPAEALAVAGQAARSTGEPGDLVAGSAFISVGTRRAAPVWAPADLGSPPWR